MPDRPADLPVAAPDPAAIRERAEYAVSDEFADMLLDAPEDAPRWAAWLGADALALLAERQQDKEALTKGRNFLRIFDSVVQQDDDGEFLLHSDADLHNAAGEFRAALAVEEDAANG